MTDFAPDPNAVVSLPSICEFCAHEHVLEFEQDAPKAPACPSCGATLEDRALAAVITGFLSKEGHLRVSHFLDEKKREGWVFGSIGSPLTGIPVPPGLIDFPVKPTARSLVSTGRGQNSSYRLPFKTASLDLLVLGGPSGLALGFAELRRVIKDTGMIVMSHGLRWPLPEASQIDKARAVFSGSGSVLVGSDLIIEARKQGLVAFFDRPAAGYLVLQRHAILVMLPIRQTAAQ